MEKGARILAPFLTPGVNMIDCTSLGKKYYPITVWNKNKTEWQTMSISEKAYNKLKKARENYKKNLDTTQEPYIILEC